MTSRSLAFVALFGGAALALIAGSQPWSRASSGPVTVAFSGIQTSGGLSQALALTVLAGTLLILVLRVRGRRTVAGLLGLLGVGLLLVGLLQREPSPALVRQQVLDISLLDTVVLQTTGWPWAYAGAGALVLVGSVLTLLRSGRWPGRTDRFRRDPAPLNDLISSDPAQLWKAMDAGLDPTIGQADHGTAGRDSPSAADPDVRKAI